MLLSRGGFTPVIVPGGVAVVLGSGILELLFYRV